VKGKEDCGGCGLFGGVTWKLKKAKKITPDVRARKKDGIFEGREKVVVLLMYWCEE
jgi:hypothetical protein